MTTKSAVGAAEGLARAAPFRLGQKAVYLPNHIVAFVRPKEGQPPTMATFNVPLTFNKLDFRDYLWNVYNVEVTAVRSFVNQMRPRQRQYGNSVGGKWYRPRSQKMMIADLAQPFVWPEAPEDLSPWDKKMYDAVESEHKKNIEAQYAHERGTPLLRDQLALAADRRELREHARALLAGKKTWKPGKPLGPAWVEVEEGDTVRSAVQSHDTARDETR